MMMMKVVALFLVLSSLVTAEVSSPPPLEKQPTNPPTQDAIDEHSTQKLKQVFLDKARDVKEHAQEAVSKALSKAIDSFPHIKTSEVSSKAKDLIWAACWMSYDFGQTTAAKVSSAVAEKVVPTVKYWVPETAEDSKQKVEEVLDKAREVKEHAKEAVSETLIKAKDSLRYRTNEVSNKAKDVIGAAYKNSYDFSQTTATKVSTAVMEKVIPTVNQYVPDEQGRAKIGKFATSFVRNAAVYGLPMFLRYWVPGGLPVYHVASRSLRDVKTEDYKEAKMKTEHYKEELKKLQAKVNKLERKLSGVGENILDDRERIQCQ